MDVISECGTPQVTKVMEVVYSTTTHQVAGIGIMNTATLLLLNDRPTFTIDYSQTSHYDSSV